ncbi:DUF2270 domain-containing protein [Bradyrhizobium sp. BRP56]|uniref:DUF2270 domain-containing protein n=1 Tax=Bradyrhizobium sp. BRP56 TaxID=2793819 RepID=UPI001CD232BC|nr:DUF2270 domain-containing protein [Bradyrhizobium sp. BRP56]MCA1399225.1 DUF2270 domain-containing protein [Bradyrhizobium sp. BRP56]
MLRDRKPASPEAAMPLPQPREPEPVQAGRLEFTAAEIGALAHLYRGEIYRSTVWRTRLDSSTNWAVVTTGIALSATYSSAEASPLPMVLVGLLVTVFLLFEARRYRYFNVWRARARLLETDFYAPMIRGEGPTPNAAWTELLANDYRRPSYHISYVRAIGRRLRRTYGWIFAIQAIAYYGKLAIHPLPLTTMGAIWDRASIGPIPGTIVILAGIAFHSSWALFAFITHRIEVADRRTRHNLIAMG